MCYLCYPRAELPGPRVLHPGLQHHHHQRPHRYHPRDAKVIRDSKNAGIAFRIFSRFVIRGRLSKTFGDRRCHFIAIHQHSAAVGCTKNGLPIGVTTLALR